MTLDERALLQERVRALILRHALEAALDRLAAATRETEKEAAAEFQSLEHALLSAARNIADRATSQKLAVLVAVEDASETLRSAFGNAHGRLDAMRAEQLGSAEPLNAVAA